MGNIHIDADWISTVAELLKEINECEKDEHLKRALALLKALEENYYPNRTVVKTYERAMQQVNGLIQDR